MTVVAFVILNNAVIQRVNMQFFIYKIMYIYIYIHIYIYIYICIYIYV